MKINQILSFTVLGSYALLAGASNVYEDVSFLQSRWAEIKYETAADKKQQAFQTLIEQAKHRSSNNPNTPEVLVWEGIILSTYAGEAGGLDALSYVESARDKLLEAEKINPDVLNGSIYTSLGSLYYQVPGWPLSFGDDEKAESYLQKSLAINPLGIDSNYFYADFLLEEGKYEEAIKYFNKAISAPARPNREVADKGRVEEAKSKLLEAKRKL